MKQEQCKGVFKEWIVPLFVSLAIVLILKHFLYDPCRVRGLSMFPTLHGTEFIIVNKWKYRMEKPKAGDIIIFHTPEKRDYIKRVIGVPGDRITIHEGHVYVNNHILKEPYIDQPTFASRDEFLVNEGQVFVLGDNRGNSTDGRVLGPTEVKDIVGRADYVLYPFSEIRSLITKS